MLASISPLGERARGQHWWVTASWYLVASVLGGATTGAMAGGAGRLLRVGWRPSDGAVTILVAVVCLAGAALDLTRRHVVLPTVHRQVNEDWLARFRGWVYGGGFGYQLGLGVVTIVTTAAVYVLVAVAVLVGSIAVGIVIGATFGASRALPLMFMALVHEPQQLRGAHRRMASWAAPAHRITVGVLAAATIASGVLAGREFLWPG